MRIVSLTMNPAVDLYAVAESVEPDIKIYTRNVVRYPGGGGINVCRAIRELGGECRALWLAGGFTGSVLRDLLDRERIDHTPIPVGDIIRENATFHEEESNREFRFVMPGPQLTEAEVERCLNAIRELDPPPDYLVLSGSLPAGAGDDFYARAVKAAPPQAKVIVDTGKRALQLAVNEGVFLIKPNLRELSQMAKAEIEDDEQIVRFSRELIEAGKCRIVVVSLGAGGAVLVTAESVEKLRAPTVTIRSKVGAGDSMVAGIVVGLARGETPERAALLGLAAGSAAVMTPGTGLCRRSDTENLYKKMLENA